MKVALRKGFDGFENILLAVLWETRFLLKLFKQMKSWDISLFTSICLLRETEATHVENREDGLSKQCSSHANYSERQRPCQTLPLSV